MAINLLNLFKGKTLQGDPIHTGAWGTKDIGLTEAIGDLFGAPRNPYSKGSELTQPFWTPDFLTDKAKQELRDGGNKQKTYFPTGGTPTTPTSDGGGGNEIPVVTDADINAAAQPLMDLYSRQEAEERAALPGYESQLQTAKELSEAKLAESERKGMETLATQEQQTREGEEQGVSKTRRLYNELIQRGISRFGSGTSAGPGYSEIIGRATAESFGLLQATANKEIGEINRDRRNIGEQVRIGNMEIDKDYNDRLLTIQETFRDRISKIDAMRAQAESWKAQKRIEELQRAREAGIALADRRDAYDYQLKLWAAANNQKLDTLENDIQSVLPDDQWITDYIQRQQNAILNPQEFGMSEKTVTPITLTGMYGSPGIKEEDNLFNPFV